MSAIGDSYTPLPRPARSVIVCDDQTEYRPDVVTLASLARVPADHLQDILRWVDERRVEVEARAAEAERVGREVAESLKPRLEANAAAAKLRGDRQRWLAGGGDAT